MARLLILLPGIFLAVARAAPATAGNPPQGCIEMNGEVRCVQGTPSKTPDWDRTIERSRALSKNCYQWVDIYRRDPTPKNATYRDAACARSAENRQRLRPADPVLESLGAPPRR
jgi:hypothetical protein